MQRLNQLVPLLALVLVIGLGVSIKKGKQDSGELIVFDIEHTGQTAGDCGNLIHGSATTTGCGNSNSRFFVGRNLTLTGFGVFLVGSANTIGACRMVIDVNGTDVVPSSPPVVGNQAVAGTTLLESAGDAYHTSLGHSVTAGDFIQVRYDTEATGCTGDPGVCPCTAQAVRLMWHIWGR